MHSQSEADWEDRVDALLGDSARRVTSYDVAKLAGVSQSAVSRTFRDGGSVSPETRAKVERAAQALGYAPNIVARSLITRRSNLIAVLVTAQTSRNYPEVLFQLGQEIQARGNRMLVFTVDFDALAAEVFNDLAGYHVDGIVAATSMEPDLLEACERHRIPLVLYNRVPRGGFASAVGCDHATGMSDLVDHLVGGTPRRVAFVAGPKGAVVSEDRLAGARQALVRHGLAIDEVIHADYSYDGGRAVGRDERGQPARGRACHGASYVVNDHIEWPIMYSLSTSGVSTAGPVSGRMDGCRTASRPRPAPTCSSTPTTRWTGGSGARTRSRRPADATCRCCSRWDTARAIGATLPVVRSGLDICGKIYWQETSFRHMPVRSVPPFDVVSALSCITFVYQSAMHATRSKAHLQPRTSIGTRRVGRFEPRPPTHQGAVALAQGATHPADW